MSCEQLCTETFQRSEATAAAAERSPPAPARSVEEMGGGFLSFSFAGARTSVRLSLVSSCTWGWMLDWASCLTPTCFHFGLETERYICMSVQ